MTIALEVELSAEQRQAMAQIVRWFKAGVSPEFRMGGLAGTGKTTLVAQVARALGLDPEEVRYCAPTGKASNVLTRKLPRLHSATTLHGLLYRPSEVHCDGCPSEETSLWDIPCHGYGRCGCKLTFEYVSPEPPKLVVVDEASMVDESMYADLCKLRSRVLYVGDHGQLPPINGALNLMAEDGLAVKLETIHRQLADSPILSIANKARKHQTIPIGQYGPGVVVGERSKAEIDWGEDVETLMVCYTNRTRVQINRLVREARGFPPGEPVPGDRVLCLKNNWGVGIVNGMVGIIQRVSRTGKNIYCAEIELPGESHNYKGGILASQFNSRETEQPPRNVDLWTYGYCLTAHKAQGSEADKVIVIKERFHPAMKKDEQQRWLYTAFTRAKQELTVVLWDR